MFNLFWIQFSTLLWKNWISLQKHPFIATIRCLILPVAYGVFLAYTQVLLHRLNKYGLGEPAPISSLANQFDGRTVLVWVDATHGTSNPSPPDIIARITSNFTAVQHAAVKQLNNTSDILTTCPLNFNGFSHCFAGLSFSDIPQSDDSRPVNYTIFADAGLVSIDVDQHTSDFETRIFPLQWAVDQAIIELQTGIFQETPLEWPYTNMTNTEQKTNIRLSYVRGIRNIIVIALFINFIGVGYQIPGAVSSDRAMLLTEYMKAMGLLDSARIMSTHIFVSLTYLPAWIAISLTWGYLIFVKTNAGLIVVVHLLLGLVLASWAFIIAVPFNTSPQLSAVVTTVFAIVLAICALVLTTSEGICGYENHQHPTNILQGDPDNGIVILPLLVAAIVDIFLWPILAVFLERCMYDTHGPGPSYLSKNKRDIALNSTPFPPDITLSIRNLRKTYGKTILNLQKKVTAVEHLSLDIPKTGIFAILGPNGAGKSTVMSIIGGLSNLTAGTITFEGGYSRPTRGTLGLVPQKNVLFPDLTCLQTLKIWKAVKWSLNSTLDEDMEQLLRDCDLGHKIHENAATLSGGQKRKLQLAIGLLGGSKIILVDECTSGVDPLSRRALWKILTTFRYDRSVVFTTHFLDEADLLADQIVIMASPGKVIGLGSPVALKRGLGEGYTMQVLFRDLAHCGQIESPLANQILVDIQEFSPLAYISLLSTSSHIYYHLKTRDNSTVTKVLSILDDHVQSDAILAYDILGTTIEDIYLDLMNEYDVEKTPLSESSNTISPPVSKTTTATNLPPGRYVFPLRQAFTIFQKRLLIAKRSWLGPILTVAVAVAGSCIPLTFIAGREQVCVQPIGQLDATSLYLPSSSLLDRVGASSRVLASPPGIISALGTSTNSLQVTNIPDNTSFVRTIHSDYHDISLGGVSLNEQKGSLLVAWDATPPGIRGSAMLNLATNILYNRALNISGSTPSTPDSIHSYYVNFPKVTTATLVYLRWMFFFGTVMAVYPAFYALYISKERTSLVQAMQFSNGLSNPIGLWLGHLMFDAISIVLLSTIIVVIFATVTDQFYGLGFLWLVLVLYGIAGALFAYCLSLMVSSPLAAFALVAGYQFIMFVLYLSSYLFILTFGTVADSSRLITIAHFSVSIVAPVTSITRAALISANLFSLACSDQHIASTTGLSSLSRYGGPILYLVVYSFTLLGVLLWNNAGSRKSKVPTRVDTLSKDLAVWSSGIEIVGELVRPEGNPLSVINLSKSFNGKQVLAGVNLSVPRDTIYALLGPNGAGKTTLFNIIRGELLPDCGDAYINDTSIVRHPSAARSALGVCPQFTAIDSQLTVREHLALYGRLKGLNRGTELESSIKAIVEQTSLGQYIDQFASKLSGGNQRKLSLAISLLGNPPVLLIDEFSTGVDARMKRGMWDTLRKVAIGKAIIITTHSMEEASALANQVGIISKRMLASGTTQTLLDQYASYEVHFTCRTREEEVKARSLMALIPGSCIIEDVSTRFEVPITQNNGLSLAQLFSTLSHHGDFMEYTVERPSLESVFLKVIHGKNSEEEDNTRRREKRGNC